MGYFKNLAIEKEEAKALEEAKNITTKKESDQIFDDTTEEIKNYKCRPCEDMRQDQINRLHRRPKWLIKQAKQAYEDLANIFAEASDHFYELSTNPYVTLEDLEHYKEVFFSDYDHALKACERAIDVKKSVLEEMNQEIDLKKKGRMTPWGEYIY